MSEHSAAGARRPHEAAGKAPRRRRRRVIATRDVLTRAFSHFNDDDGWAMASHVALQILLSLFPFLIVVAAIAGAIGSEELAGEVTELVFETWPKEVARPIAEQAHEVLTRNHTSAITLGLLFSFWFASNGVEAIRSALNRAYRLVETRSYVMRRLQSFLFVCLGAFGLLSLAILVVFGPLLWDAIVWRAPWLANMERGVRYLRLGVATAVLGIVLVASHVWLPCGRRGVLEILPGVVVTLVAWLVAGAGFGFYLHRFATYSNTYAGLANVTVAIVFLYLISTLFLAGAEINAAVGIRRAERRTGQPAGPNPPKV
ncbi:membrane protein [Pseudoxanthobacter soli DSM 19599]|uniref:Membrane protein n=1 Tax=Pseudoxanthobacter soli DSM 19599 TaxID=1123029 RepID=A0A1M7ZFZ9_9HYPH|nr:YihY/virulence factor BrkB family protein [Pseudoxanthobacter soli]SHO63596.1 membrane protein [Pseudoxanthobacter soli DSM 19599]